MKKIIKVVGAILIKEGRILCAQRGGEKSLPFLWEFPGGKIEQGESPHQALIRELSEELLIEVELDNDQIKIDGNMAIAWSGALNFTVEKSTRSLIGSAVAGEGFVNVYRGTGKVLMAPVRPETVSNILNYKSNVRP